MKQKIKKRAASVISTIAYEKSAGDVSSNLVKGKRCKLLIFQSQVMKKGVLREKMEIRILLSCF